jgi:hypothetical protein
MKLKLKESIRVNGQQIRPPAVIDTIALGITDISAQVLVTRGTAEHYDEPSADAPAASVEQPVEQADDQPDVINLGDDVPAQESQPAVSASPEVINLGDEPSVDAPAGKKSGKRK